MRMNVSCLYLWEMDSNTHLSFALSPTSSLFRNLRVTVNGSPQQINLNSAGLLINEVRRVPPPHHYKTFLCHNNYKTCRLLLIFVMVLDDVEACHLICECYQQSMWRGVIPDCCAPPTYVSSEPWPFAGACKHSWNASVNYTVGQ